MNAPSSRLYSDVYHLRFSNTLLIQSQTSAHPKNWRENLAPKMQRIPPKIPALYKALQSPIPPSPNQFHLQTQKSPFLSDLKMDKIMGFGPPLPSKKVEEIKEPSLKHQKLDNHNGVEPAAAFLKVKKLSDKAVIPSRGSPLAAGYDLSSAVHTNVPGRGKALVATELSIAIPEGTYGRIAPRSGLAWKHSLDVGAGVIDADYRGSVSVILFNHSDTDFEVKVGDRIAQLIIEKIVTPDVIEVDDLDSTVRGAGGFGSTGV